MKFGNFFKSICLSVFTVLIVHLIISCSDREELKWNEEEGYRWAKINPGLFGSTGFEKLNTGKTSIHFRNDVSEDSIVENRQFLNGSGVTLGDINGNGLVDIYFASISGPNKLYKNLGGFRFEDITEEAGVAHDGYHSTGVVFADVNGNGHLDLLVASLGQGTSLYINDGEGKFELNEDCGLNSTSGNHTMALADITGNGYLDLYVVNGKTKSVMDMYDITDLFVENIVTGNGDSYELVPPFDDHFTLFVHKGNPDPRQHAEEDEVYINQGDGTFKKKSKPENFFLDESGNELGFKPDWGLSAKFQDLNGNGLPDLYVNNDFWTPDRVWMNQGDGTFRAIDKHAFRNFSYSSMDVDFSDINRNGLIDIFITEMLSPFHEFRATQSVNQSPEPIQIGDINSRALLNQNSLYVNRGDNSYAQMAFYSGVAASGWSWTAKFLDVDLDGYEDILIATGNSRDGRDLGTQDILGERLSRGQLDSETVILEYPERSLQNIIFQNNGDLTFSDKSSEWGFTDIDVSHGLAVADLNNNGVLDVVINRMNKEAVIYRNRTNAPRIAVRLKGNYPNTMGIGAKITLEGGPVKQSKEVAAGGEYLSGSDQLVVFAANKDNHELRLTVRWPKGSKSIIENVRANRIYEIDEASGKNLFEAESGSYEEPAKPLFKDASQRINHKHHENEFDDFQIQPLLPLKLSQQGPGISWIDINRNGYDDLLITTGKGGKNTIYENQGDGEFRTKEINSFNDSEAPGDHTSIIGWGEEGSVRLIVGNVNYEQGDIDVPSAFDLKITSENNVIKQEISANSSTTGPLAAADYNGNGFVDLFIGGRFMPGRYPVNASSRLYINDGDSFQLDKQNSEIFKDIGLVTAATFVDINNNGQQDIILSTEWGSIRVFKNEDGTFQEITENVGLDKFKGWWNGIAVGDFTNNGLPDIVAANLGLNSIYGNVFTTPLKMFYGDFNWDGRLNIIEAYFHEGKNTYLPIRKLYDLEEEIPQLTREIRTHKEFSEVSINDLLQLSAMGIELDELPSKSINTLEHMLFINEGGSFIANPLPLKSQLSSAFYVGIADFDNDGNEDIFLSQNKFSFAKTTPRLDAGQGLVLKGNGKGEFKALSSHESGIEIYGQQRGAALSDFNQNGRTDLVVSQNGAETKLYLNQTEKRGLRVRLNGPKNNRDAIGSSLQIVYKDGTKGPRRYIQAGSGYLSQNSVTQVIGKDTSPDKIRITWFDGKIQTEEVSNDIYDYDFNHNDD